MGTDLVLTDELVATIADNADQVCKADELGRESWLRTRKPFIGGSEAAASIGLNPYRSQYALWVDKTTDTVSDEDNEYMKWGRRLEEPIGYGIAEDHSIPVVRYPYMMASKRWPWAAVNVDFLSGETEEYPPSVVEVKNVSSHMSREWDDAQVPTSYAIQGQHACAVLGLPGVHFFPLIGGHEGRPIYVPRNDTLIDSLMEGERKFWELVENMTPPAIDGSLATLNALKAQFAHVDADTEIDLTFTTNENGVGVNQLLVQRAESKAIIKDQEGIVREIENQLKAWLGNYECAVVNDVIKFTWKLQHRDAYAVEPNDFRKLYVAPNTKKGIR